MVITYLANPRVGPLISTNSVNRIKTLCISLKSVSPFLIVRLHSNLVLKYSIDTMSSRRLSNDQLLEFKDAFDYFDKNRDGKITIDEMGIVMKNLGSNINPYS